jgi:hypothetical protein
VPVWLPLGDMMRMNSNTRAHTITTSSSTEVLQRMVSAERELKEQADAERYWELQRSKSLGAQLQATRESLMDNEEAYWAIRRQQSFGEALRRDWGAGDVDDAADSTGGGGGMQTASAASQLPPSPQQVEQEAGRALSQVQQQIEQLNKELDIPRSGYALHPGGLATLPPPPTDSTRIDPHVTPAPTERKPTHRNVRQYHQLSREQLMEEHYWAQESALRRQRSLTELAWEAEESERARGGGALDWSIPAYLSTDVTKAASEYLQAGRRAAEQALSAGHTVAKAAAEVTNDVRGDLADVVAKVSTHVNDAFTAPPPLSDEDAYWQGRS